MNHVNSVLPILLVPFTASNLEQIKVFVATRSQHIVLLARNMLSESFIKIKRESGMNIKTINYTSILI